MINLDKITGADWFDVSSIIHNQINSDTYNDNEWHPPEVVQDEEQDEPNAGQS